MLFRLFLLYYFVLQWLIAESSNISHSDVKFFFLLLLRNEINLRLASNKKRYILVSVRVGFVLMLLFFFVSIRKSLDTIVMISKYTFPACRELLFAHQFRQENKAQDVYFVYLSLHWHFRKKQRQIMKTTKKCCAKIHLTCGRK